MTTSAKNIYRLQDVLLYAAHLPNPDAEVFSAYCDGRMQREMRSHTKAGQRRLLAMARRALQDAGLPRANALACVTSKELTDKAILWGEFSDFDTMLGEMRAR